MYLQFKKVALQRQDLSSIFFRLSISALNTFTNFRFLFEVRYSITPYLFPFIMSDSNSVLLFTLGIVLLLCDAPFIEEDQPYIILRSGRKLWTLGQMLYMCIATFSLFCIYYYNVSYNTLALSWIQLRLGQGNWNFCSNICGTSA